MKSGVAWNVKGVGLEAREAARDAAERAGVSVGEWLDSVITGQASGAASDESAHRSGTKREAFSTIHQHLDALADRLGKIGSASETRPNAGLPSDVPSHLRGLDARLAGISKDLARCSHETPHRVAEAIQRLNDRLDHLIDSGRRAASEFENRVAAVDHALDDIEREPPRSAFAVDPQIWSTDDTIREITARQRVLDQPPAGKGRSAGNNGLRPANLDQQIRALSRQIEKIREPFGFERAIAALREEIGKTRETVAAALPRQALNALRSELDAVTDRLRHGRLRHGDARGIAAIEQGLDKVKKSLASLTPAENVGPLEAALESLAGKLDILAANGPDAASLQYLQTAVAELRGLTDRIASSEGLARLARQLGELAECVDRIAAQADAAEARFALEQRVDALGAMIETRTAEAGRAISARLEPLVKTLLAQLEALDLNGGDQSALVHIQHQIAKLSGKIEKFDARLGTVDMIERRLADLFHQIEESRANSVDAAEFKRDLADLRLTQTEAEGRNSQALRAIHDTIAQLTERIAAVEAERRSEAARRTAPPAAAPARASAPPAAKPLHHVNGAGSAGAAAVPARAAAPIALPARAPIDPGLPGDHPIEPGKAARTSAAERIAASEVALGTVRPSGTAEPGDKANFIAAARRAAQAAAAEAAQGGGRRRAEGAEGESDETALTMGRLKRPLFMSVAAAVVVLGATHVALTMLSSSHVPQADGSAKVAVVPAARETPKPPAAPPVSTAAVAEQPAKPAALPLPDSQLLSAKSLTTMPAPSASAAVPPRQEANAAASPWDVAAVNPQPADLTGSVTKPADKPATPNPDSLPAAIGGPALRSAAVGGNAAAQYEIAVRYAEGRGVPQSFAEAARWFERAANQGVAPAQYRLGSLYEKGNGVKKDLETARRLYTAAAEKANARAMHNLAVLYAEGADGKPEYKTAFHWFRKAAGYGVADSQYNLGILYARGIGVEQNLAESYKWFALAAQQGDFDAGRKRDDVAARLDPQSLVAAKLAAQTFTAESQPEEATTVKPPGDGWDRPAAAPATTPAAKQKAAPRRT